MDRPPLRLLHCADIHLAYEIRDASLEVLGMLRARAEEHAADCLVIAGDLFDTTRQPDAFVADVAEELARLRIPIVTIPGNHDIRDGEGVGPAFGDLMQHLEARATPLAADDGGSATLADGRLTVWGRGMPEHSPRNDPLTGLPHLEADGAWHVALAHGFLMQAPNGRSSPIILGRHEAALASFDYVALGHRHFATQLEFGSTLVTDPGSPRSAAGGGTYALVEFEEGHVTSTIHSLPRSSFGTASGQAHGLH